MYYKDNPWFNRENFIYYLNQLQLPIHIFDNPLTEFNCQKLDYIIVTSDSEYYNNIDSTFPYYASFPNKSGDIRLEAPLCRLERLETSVLPNQVEAQIWKVQKR